MHTFFINTSEKKLENYDSFFEVQHKTRKLISLNCPLSKWREKEKCNEADGDKIKEGYELCVDKMGEMIDNYKDITNTFNLILYVDLLQFKEYTSISMDNHIDRKLCLAAMHSLLKHYIYATLVEKLNSIGRKPVSVLVIFEEGIFPEEKAKSGDLKEEKTRYFVERFLDFPDDIDRRIEESIKSVPKEKRTQELFYSEIEKIQEEYLKDQSPSLVKDILSTYPTPVSVFLDGIDGNKSIKDLLDILYQSMLLQEEKEDKEIKHVSFETNRKAERESKQANARRELGLYFYLFSCVEEQSIFDKNASSESNNKEVKKFREINWEKVGSLLNKKCAKYKAKVREISNLEQYTSKLAPMLYEIDNEKFGLDEYGDNMVSLEIRDVEEDEDNDGDDIIGNEDKREIVINDQVPRKNLLDKYTTFDYNGDTPDHSQLDRSASPKKFEAAAKELVKHHCDYMRKLNYHITDGLSNYAGRSLQRSSAVLPKRKVSLEDDIFDDDKGYEYAKIEDGTIKPEERKIETVKNMSDHAYETTYLNYMNFCAGRGVALTNIEEQCNWFLTRVKQIKKSLKKIKYAAIGMLFAIIFLYVPFFLVQFESIIDNVATISTAAASFAIPVAILYLILAFVYRWQKTKYYIVWKQFKEKSDEALEENKEAIEKYDQLLTIYIPALRFVYEYKLDIDFYNSCCNLAKAKLAHHATRLKTMKEMIENMIDDLEIDVRDEFGEDILEESGVDIDYQLSFCSGAKNRKFYSIIDDAFLKAIYKKEGGK